MSETNNTYTDTDANGIVHTFEHLRFPTDEQRAKYAHTKADTSERLSLVSTPKNVNIDRVRAITSQHPINWQDSMIPWPDPTPEQLNSFWFNRIWDVIKTWDINVPEVYEGYCGATGNHVVAILNAISSKAMASGVSVDTSEFDIEQWK